MDNLNNIEVLTEMEVLESTEEFEKKNDEFPFIMDMTNFWNSLVCSIENKLEELKINGQLYRLFLSAYGV